MPMEKVCGTNKYKQSLHLNLNLNFKLVIFLFRNQVVRGELGGESLKSGSMMIVYHVLEVETT